MGLELTPDDLGEMVKAMDIHGDDCVPTAPVLKFLREEARAASKSGAVALSKVSSCFFRLFSQFSMKWANRIPYGFAFSKAFYKRGPTT